MDKATVVVSAICFFGMFVLWWNDFGNIRMPPFMNPMSLDVRQEYEGHHLYVKYAFFDPLRYIVCLEAGILMVCGSVTWFYWKATMNLKATQGLIIAAFTCSLMPLFELLNLTPWWWTILVLIPSVVLGGLWLNWDKFRGKKLRQMIVWDEAGSWIPWMDKLCQDAERRGFEAAKLEEKEQVVKE